MKVLSVIPQSFNDLKKILKQRHETDLIELRLDNINFNDLISFNFDSIFSSMPLILTLRSKQEGGFFSEGEEKRIQLIKKIINSENKRIEFIDLEHSIQENTLKKLIESAAEKNKKIILSSHNLKKAFSKQELKKKFLEMKKFNAEVIKIIGTASKLTDNLILIDLLKELNQKKNQQKVSLALMAEKGQPSRILGALFGNYLTYCALNEESLTASGQITLKELNEFYVLERFKEFPKLFSVIGNPVKHSKGNIIHNLAMINQKINGLYIKLFVDDLHDFFIFFNELNFSGASITSPHKEAVIPFLDSLDPLAEKIQSVNTIARENGKLKGFNTDCFGAINSLKELTELKGKKVALIGAGGAANAVAFGLKKEKSNLTIVNRDEFKGRKLAEENNAKFLSLKEFQEKEKLEFDVIINATTIGMTPNINESLIKKSQLNENQIVFDLIYSPPETKLFKEAKEAGCKTINGFRMLVLQAAKQFELWHKKPAPIELMQKILNEIFEAKK